MKRPFDDILGSRRIGVALVVALTGAPSATHAQQLSDAASAARRELIDHALEADANGDHASALEQATRAGNIQMTLSLRRFIAEQQAALGHVADAYRSAEVCIANAQHDTGQSVLTHLAACRGLVIQLAPRVGHVTVAISNTPPGVHVTIAGTEIDASLLGVPYVCDPGSVRVVAAAPGFDTATRNVECEANGNASLPITLRAAPSTASATATPRTDIDRPTPSRVPAGPIVVGAVGLASFGVALGLFVARNDAMAERDRDCPEPMGANCPDFAGALAAHQRASTLNDVTIAADIVGGVALAGATAWLIASLVTSRSPVAPRAALRHNGASITFEF